MSVEATAVVQFSVPRQTTGVTLAEKQLDIANSGTRETVLRLCKVRLEDSRPRPRWRVTEVLGDFADQFEEGRSAVDCDGEPVLWVKNNSMIRGDDMKAIYA